MKNNRVKQAIEDAIQGDERTQDSLDRLADSIETNNMPKKDTGQDIIELEERVANADSKFYTVLGIAIVLIISAIVYILGTEIDIRNRNTIISKYKDTIEQYRYTDKINKKVVESYQIDVNDKENTIDILDYILREKDSIIDNQDRIINNLKSDIKLARRGNSNNQYYLLNTNPVDTTISIRYNSKFDNFIHLKLYTHDTL